MADADDRLEAFGVQDVHEVLREELVAGSLPVCRFGRSIVPKAVGDNETVDAGADDEV